MSRRESRPDGGRRRPAPALLGSPLRDGVAAALVIVVAFALTWKIDQGLPGAPAYELDVLLPHADTLFAAAEVRVAGFRAGKVLSVEPATAGDRAIARARLRLDRVVEELPRDSTLIVRPLTAGGLAYLELTPGSSRRTFAPGETVPLSRAEPAVEIDEVLAAFDPETRHGVAAAIEAAGTALAGRGPSVNEALAELPRMARHLGPVMHSLSRPSTRLARTIDELADTARGVAPVGGVAAGSFEPMADTFAAVGRDPDALRETIEGAAPTARASRASFADQGLLLRDATSLAARLRPGLAELDRALPRVNDALAVGTDALEPTPRLADRAADVFRAGEELTENPNALLALGDLRRALAIGAPFIEYVAPYQTVCNYFVLSFTNQGEAASEIGGRGHFVRTLIKTTNAFQDDRVGDFGADRPADVPANLDPQEASVDDLERFRRIEQDTDDELDDAVDALDAVEAAAPGDILPRSTLPDPVGELLGDGEALTAERIALLRRSLRQLVRRLEDDLDALEEEGDQDLTVIHAQPYGPAIDGQGNADCQSGQTGFLDRLITTGRYPPSNNPERNGGSHVVLDSNTPGLAGPTFSGVPSLRDVDDEQRSRHPRGEVPVP